MEKIATVSASFGTEFQKKIWMQIMKTVLSSFKEMCELKNEKNLITIDWHVAQDK